MAWNQIRYKTSLDFAVYEYPPREFPVPQHLGLELSQLLDEYAQYPLCYGQQYRARLSECKGPADVVAIPHEHVEFEIDLRCRSRGVIGPFDGRVIAIRRMLIPQDMRIGVFIMNEAGQEVGVDFNIAQCAACSEHADLWTSWDPSVVFDFDAGMYELLIFADLDDERTLTVRLVATSP